MLRGLQQAKPFKQLASSRLGWPQQLGAFSTVAEKVIELSSDADIKKALASGKLSVLDFTAKWCGPCKMIAPEYSKMSAEFPKAAFYKVDIDNPDVQSSVSSHQVAAVPTFKFMQGEEVIAQIQGADKVALRKVLQQHAQ